MNEKAMQSLETALKLFRVMAIWCGVMSLLLWFVNVPTHYWVGKSFHHYFVWVAIVHGMTYPIYVLAAFNYSLKSNKSFTQTIIFILAGTLPVASFIAERKAVSDFNALKAAS